MSELDSTYLVFGFIAEMESKLSNIAIPRTLKELCFKFYCINEEFDDHGPSISLNETKDTASHDTSIIYNTVYGIQVIDPTNDCIKAYTWTLKIY